MKKLLEVIGMFVLDCEAKYTPSFFVHWIYRHACAESLVLTCTKYKVFLIATSI